MGSGPGIVKRNLNPNLNPPNSNSNPRARGWEELLVLVQVQVVVYGVVFNM
jgi:hypothetical protein